MRLRNGIALKVKQAKKQIGFSVVSKGPQVYSEILKRKSKKQNKTIPCRLMKIGTLLLPTVCFYLLYDIIGNLKSDEMYLDINKMYKTSKTY